MNEEPTEDTPDEIDDPVFPEPDLDTAHSGLDEPLFGEPELDESMREGGQGEETRDDG
jgi:hypothetical protein